MATADTDRAMEDPCPTCGAMVRRGLVRCWSCGAFMRPDIAAKFERMQQRQPEVEFKPLPEQGRGKPAVVETVESDDESDFEFGGSLSDFDLEVTSKTAAKPASADRPQRAGNAFSGHRPPASPAGSSSAAKPEPAPKAEPAPKLPETPENKEAAEKAKFLEERRKAEEAEAHATAVAADALLQVALQEEKESKFRGRNRKAAFDPVRISDGWMITCPCPARIRIKVRESHCGKTGKCPNPSCGSYFTVPADLPRGDDETAAANADGATESTAYPADPAEKAGPYTHWIRDIRFHAIKPAKAKRKPGAHEKDFVPADLGFSQSAGLALLSLTVKPAGLVAKKKKPEQVREEIVAALRDGQAAADVPSEKKLTFEPTSLGKLMVEYPPAYEHESTFAGVAVFGEGRITIRLPQGAAADEREFVSLTISQYQQFAELLEGLYDIQQFGLGCPIPKPEDVVTVTCHYTENPLTVLRNPSFHLADPQTPLEPVGYRCESCGLIVSEDARKKEKIGGLDGKKLAGAKCPKCKGKFGDNPLYAPKTSTPAEAAPAAEAKA